MNTFAFLLMTSCAVGSDPQPIFDAKPYAMPSSNYVTQEMVPPQQQSRPRFFARLRGMFSRKPQGMDMNSQEPPLSMPSGTIVNGSTQGTIVYPSGSTGASNSTILRSQPIAAPSTGTGFQRMPSGQPF